MDKLPEGTPIYLLFLLGGIKVCRILMQLSTNSKRFASFTASNQENEAPNVWRQLVLPVATFILAGFWASSTVHRMAV